MELSWITGDYNFPKFALIRLREHSKYKDKPMTELKSLFVNAFTWEDYRAEYPKWRQNKEQEQATKEKREARELAMKKTPQACPKCNVELNGRLICPEHGELFFSEIDFKYQFAEYAAANLYADFIEHQKMKAESRLNGALTNDCSNAKIKDAHEG